MALATGFTFSADTVKKAFQTEPKYAEKLRLFQYGGMQPWAARRTDAFWHQEPCRPQLFAYHLKRAPRARSRVRLYPYSTTHLRTVLDR